MSPAVTTLRRQSLGVALAGGGCILLLGVSQPRWLIGSFSVWVYCLWLLFHHLEDNRARGGDALIPSLGLPTAVTLLRGCLLAAVAGFFFVPIPQGPLVFVPAVGYSLASVLDNVDGRIARAFSRTTRLGARLDMELDAVGILVASAVAIHFGKIPAWYLSIGLARYVFVAGIWWRERHGRVVETLAPSSYRRWLAGVQMGFLSVSLWPPVPTSLTFAVAPLFGGITLAMFLRDWLQVSGRLTRTA